MQSVVTLYVLASDEVHGNHDCMSRCLRPSTRAPGQPRVLDLGVSIVYHFHEYEILGVTVDDCHHQFSPYFYYSIVAFQDLMPSQFSYSSAIRAR